MWTANSKFEFDVSLYQQFNVTCCIESKPMLVPDRINVCFTQKFEALKAGFRSYFGWDATHSQGRYATSLAVPKRQLRRALNPVVGERPLNP